MRLTNPPTPTHAPEELLPDWMRPERTFSLTPDLLLPNKASSTITKPAAIVYWMQRDVRSVDNWALLWPAHVAETRSVPLQVVYALPPRPAEVENDDDDDELAPALADMPMTERYGSFLLGGLECVHGELEQKNIPLHIVMAPSDEQVGTAVCEKLLQICQPELVITDFSPLRQFRQWKELQAAPLLAKAQIPFYQVDAHNIVPVWSAADKRQVGARTLRPRIQRVVDSYLQEYPVLPANQEKGLLASFERSEYESYLDLDSSVPAVDWATPGTAAATKQFRLFLQSRLKKFDTARNDPTQRHACSDLSPWINAGHISFATIMREVKKLNKYASGTASYLEEGVIRRELSDNCLYYSPNDYDSLETAAGWAQETLQVHSTDPREHLYTLQQLEAGQTHDDLWNAAQLQVVQEGQMHGFLRMYWAKKILEWTPSPNFALRAAQYLNDKYALDGRDPNGFVGVGWSIMGIHDMGWKERAIFGKIRYMNYNGCKRKFKVDKFVAMYPGAAENAAKAANKNGARKKKQQKEEKAVQNKKRKTPPAS